MVSLNDCMPGGAHVRYDNQCQWRVWAPHARTLELVLYSGAGSRSIHGMRVDELGYYTCCVNDIAEGQRYVFRINRERERPDPASRWQPEGVHKPSAVWCPESFEWTDTEWKGISRENLVLYEMHVGTFTPEGTFAAIGPRLKMLRDLGVTAIELMPVAQFAGRWNWGYDSVYWNAVQNTYGGPRELQNFVNACHETDLAVILHVVYNHFGPEGNYLRDFGPYVTDRVQTSWGPAVKFSDTGAHGVRALVRENVQQWIRDFHIDGLRLDATDSICDLGPRHLVAEIKAAAVEETTRSSRSCHLIAESHLNDASLILSEERGGYGLDVQRNDDFQHCVHALLTSEVDGHCIDLAEPKAQLAQVLNGVFASECELNSSRSHRYSSPVGNLSGDQFVVSIQTHDQIGNRVLGDRLSQLVGPAELRLAASLMILSPYTPQLFMGEEYGESSPFLFFCDFSDSQARDEVRAGRRRELPELAKSGELSDPLAESTFRLSKLDWPDSMNEGQRGQFQLYHDLIAARRHWPALQNRHDRTARIVKSIEGLSLLWLTRGVVDEISGQIEIYFNLTQHSVTLSSHAHKGLEVILRSEDSKYAGTAWGGRFWGQLNPHECIVFRRKQ
jgi:maltooligosyltrehalose trehalohydrolase